MAREAVYIRIVLEEMGHKQPSTPLQTDNTTSEAVCNGKIQPNSGAYNRPIYFFHLIFFIADLSYVGFVPLGDFVGMLGDKKMDLVGTFGQSHVSV
jgi:hypothetical protein